MFKIYRIASVTLNNLKIKLNSLQANTVLKEFYISFP